MSHKLRSSQEKSIGNGKTTQTKKGLDGKSTELPSTVAQLYYKHGLFLTSYPTCAISLALLLVMFCCYPLSNIPLPGTIPTRAIQRYSMISPAATTVHSAQADDADSSKHNSELNPDLILPTDSNKVDPAPAHPPKSFLNFGTNHLYRLYTNLTSTSTMLISDPPFPWSRIRIDPYIYVQQILMKSVVLPWNKKLQLTDAFRGPLFEVFKLLEIINNHEDSKKVAFSNLCLHVENVKRQPKKQVLFPEYNCLMLSPANLWKQNVHSFNKDNSLLSTIFAQHNFRKSSVSTAEILFGIPMSDTGIKRYPMRIRPRTIQYAITMIMRENNPEYLSSLKQKLHKLYPLHQKSREGESYVQYVYYPSQLHLAEFVPLCTAFAMLFAYVYFSIRKVDVIKSRLVLASFAVVTIAGSLGMSMGVCFFFGLTVNTQSKGVYPFLVLLVGLENCLVLTKSIMLTDNKLDLKIRMAQGLSKEGWSITKNLLTEITILTVGLATFVPIIQEFCIFAIVGLLSDFILQMLLFSTVLGLNIKNADAVQEVKQLPRMYGNVFTFDHAAPPPVSSAGKSADKKIPKRLRVVNFWARTRIFQRGFMIWMVLWISNIIYNSGIIENMFFIDKFNSTHDAALQNNPNEHPSATGTDYEHMIKNLSNIMSDFQSTKNLHSSIKQEDIQQFNISEMIQRIKHIDYEINSKLSEFHWSSILDQYNISMSGQYVTVLPSIKLSHVVPYEMALKIRNPNEKLLAASKWNALAVALDPIDFSDFDADHMPIGNQPLYPKTPMEIVLTSILCIVSIIVITYTIVVMYRCICSRNYAEWRASWNDTERIETKSEHILEGFPVQVRGHTHNIECIVTNNYLIASSCLQGQLKIWDATNGEQVAEIDRVKYFERMRQHHSDYQLVSMSSDSLPASSSATSSKRPVIVNREIPEGNQLRLRNLIKFDFQSSCTSASSSQTNNDDGSDGESKPKRRSLQEEFQESFEKYFKYPGSADQFTSSHPYFTSEHSENESFLSLRGRSGRSAAAPNTAGVTSASKSNVQRSNSLHNDSLDKCYLSSPIWSLDFVDNLIVIGCADGRVEIWEGTTGNFKCIYEGESTRNNGVTHIKLYDDRVIAARLSGRIDFLRLETYTQGRHIDWQFTSAYRRTHVRTGSAGSIGGVFNQPRNLQRNSLQSTQNLANPNSPTNPSASSLPPVPPTADHPQQPSPSSNNEEMRCILESQHQGHQQPVTCLDVFDGIVFTGSQDHTLKIFRLGNNTSIALHGHLGPITSLFIDRYHHSTGCSGSQEGLLVVWDLDSGACIYSLEAHEESIVSMTSSPSYIISLGLDERLRVWERFQGHLLNTIIVGYPFTNIEMLTTSLLVTGKPGSLLVWDLQKNEPAQEVKLDGSNRQLCPKNILSYRGTIICDYGNQLRLVRFPIVTSDKRE